jgi:tRNA A-37 threonylcarbamoyl transferase component Bud32
MTASADNEIVRLRALPWGEIATLDLSLNGSPLTVEKVLRHLPGRRVAVQATWRGKVVFAKIFLTSDASVVEAEINCIQALSASGIATPSLLAHQVFEQGALIVCQWCEGISAEDALRVDADKNVSPLMAAVFSLYAAGVYQRDLHLNNFILFEQKFLVIDAGDIKPLPISAAERQRVIIENLALFCAQGSLDVSALLEQHVRSHMSDSGIPLAGFAKKIVQMRQKRLRNAMKKWRRESSAIGMRLDGDEQWLWQRTLNEEDISRLTELLREPARAPLIKRGSRISVYGNERWIIKHYRESGFIAKLKRLFFRGRADISWVIGWTWRLLGVPTPQPLMLRRCANGEAVIACQRIAAEPLSRLMEQGAARASHAGVEVTSWLARLHDAGFWHGDTKAQNILCDENGSWFIDLDAAGWSAREGRVQRRAEKDMARFKRNDEQFVASSVK